MIACDAGTKPSDRGNPLDCTCVGDGGPELLDNDGDGGAEHLGGGAECLDGDCGDEGTEHLDDGCR